eukprot:15431427-Alexandrium_andersonii.AAC.1
MGASITFLLPFRPHVGFSRASLSLLASPGARLARACSHPCSPTPLVAPSASQYQAGWTQAVRARD